MKRTPTLLFLLVALATCSHVNYSQKRTSKVRAVTARGTVVDERLAVVRDAPSLGARPVTRLGRGRAVGILSTTLNAEGGFYRVAITRKRQGWLLREALATPNRPRDDERLARLIDASEGYDRAQRAAIFLELFPSSTHRPDVLLAFGDAVESALAKISRDAARRLAGRETAASEASRRSFFLSLPALDRFGRLGARFRFDEAASAVCYDGAAWREIVERFPRSEQAAEARRRLERLSTSPSLTTRGGGRRRPEDLGS